MVYLNAKLKELLEEVIEESEKKNLIISSNKTEGVFVSNRKRPRCFATYFGCKIIKLVWKFIYLGRLKTDERNLNMQRNNEGYISRTEQT